MIDPGHGGIDNGTRAASGETEKKIVLDFALLLRDQLEKTGKYRVVMTRTDDTFVPLAERVRIARARAGRAVHLDPRRRAAQERGRGAGRDRLHAVRHRLRRRGRRLAEAENRADVIAGIDLSHEPDDVADILIDLAQRETKTFSVHFAQDAGRRARDVARLHKHPLKSAGFQVLKAPDVPSVLVELGYVSNSRRPQAPDLGGLARRDRGLHRPGGRHLLQHADGRCAAQADRSGRQAGE